MSSTPATESTPICTTSGALTQIQRSMEQAAAKKEAGNIAFKEGNFKVASFNYKQVAMVLGELVSKAPKKDDSGSGAQGNDGFVSMFKNRAGGEGSSVVTLRPDASEQDAIDELYASTQSNLAAAHNKLQRYAEAKACATQALMFYRKLQISPASAKPDVEASEAPKIDKFQFTPAQKRAYFRRAQAQTQLGNWEEAKKDLLYAGQDDAAVREQLALIEALELKNVQQEKKMYARMFSSE